MLTASRSNRNEQMIHALLYTGKPCQGQTTYTDHCWTTVVPRVAGLLWATPSKLKSSAIWLLRFSPVNQWTIHTDNNYTGKAVPPFWKTMNWWWNKETVLHAHSRKLLRGNEQPDFKITMFSQEEHHSINNVVRHKGLTWASFKCSIFCVYCVWSLQLLFATATYDLHVILTHVILHPLYSQTHTCRDIQRGSKSRK